MSDGSDVRNCEISSKEEYDNVVIYGIELYKYEPEAENTRQCPRERIHVSPRFS